MAIEMNDELRAKLLKAKGPAEVASALEEAGQEATAEEIERIVAELRHAAEHDGEWLSLDELDAVAGGGWWHDYAKEGCVATVEYGSNCLGEDGGCSVLHNTYNGRPVNVQCTCGRWVYKDHLESREGGATVGILTCPYCKKHYECDQNIWFGLTPG